MGSIRGRIGNLEAKADEDLITLVADDGEELRLPGDMSMGVFAAFCQMVRGEDPEDPFAERLVEEEEDRGWREKHPEQDGTLFSLTAKLRESRLKSVEGETGEG